MSIDEENERPRERALCSSLSSILVVNIYSPPLAGLSRLTFGSLYLLPSFLLHFKGASILFISFLPNVTRREAMNLRVYILGLAGAAAAGFTLVFAAVVQPRQENENTMDLYLCSNPNFNHDCAGCACERLANLTTSGGYGGPPCCMSLPFHYIALRPSQPSAPSLRSNSRTS